MASVSPRVARPASDGRASLTGAGCDWYRDGEAGWCLTSEEGVGLLHHCVS